MSHKYLKIGMLVLLVTCLCVGCVGEQNAKADDGRLTSVYMGNFGYGANEFSIFHDNVNNVTIYVYWGHGISAIPDWQLTAPKNTTE